MSANSKTAKAVKPMGTAKVEIDTGTLLRLLQQNQMSVSELRCLDDSTKHLVRKICLSACLRKAGLR